MARYGSDDIELEIDSTTGGSLVSIKAHVTSFNGFKLNPVIEDGTPYGVAFPVQIFSGFKAGDNITLEGFFDDAAGGPKAIFQGHEGEQRTFKVTWGSTNTTTGEVLILSFNKRSVAKESVKYTAELIWTGTITEA